MDNKFESMSRYFFESYFKNGFFFLIVPSFFGTEGITTNLTDHIRTVAGPINKSLTIQGDILGPCPHKSPKKLSPAHTNSFFPKP